MICKTCGMDSKTAGTCSWCGASLVSPDEAPVETKPERARPVLREEVLEPEAQEAEVEIGAVPSLNNLQTERRPVPISELSASTVPAPSPTSAPSLKVTAARKMAPPLPPPGNKLRAPAPGAPPPPSRAASLLQTPTIGNISDTGKPAAAPITMSASVHTPIASLQEQADALIVSSVVENPPASLSSAVAENILSTLPAQSAPMEAIPAPALRISSDTSSAAETAIGSGVTPVKSATPVASATPSTISEQQKRAAVKAALSESVESPMALLGRYLGVFVVIMLVTGLLAHALPRFYLLPMILAMFVSALLLPIMRVTPWVEEDAEDMALFIGLTLLFGPLVALIIYGAVAVFRQSFNASVLGGLAVAALLRIVAEVGAGNVTGVGQLFSMTSPFANLQHVDSGILKLMLRNWAGLAALAGWYAASSFHKEDE